MTNVLLPRSLDDLWRHWENEPAALLYAGGTDLLVKMRSGSVKPKNLICLERLEELQGVSEAGDFIRIGSGTKHTLLLESLLVRKHLPILVQALAGVGSPLIRNMGTIGGNICTASPAGDTLPPLYVLEADVELCRQGGVRRLPIKDFLTGPGQTKLGQGEILTTIWVPKADGIDGYNLQHFEKVGQRNALAIAIVSLAALVHRSPAGMVEKAHLAWGSLGPTIVTCPEAEAALVGERLTSKTLQHAAALIRQAASPISDIRAAAAYRRALAGNLLLRLLEIR